MRPSGVLEARVTHKSGGRGHGADSTAFTTKRKRTDRAILVAHRAMVPRRSGCLCVCALVMMAAVVVRDVIVVLHVVVVCAIAPLCGFHVGLQLHRRSSTA